MQRAIQDLDLFSLLEILIARRRIVALGAATGLIGGVLFLILAVPQYRATMLIGPAWAPVRGAAPEDIQTPARLSGNFASEEEADYTRLEYILREPSAAARLFDDPAIRDGIARDTPVRFGSGPRLSSPEDLARYLSDHVSIEPVGASTLRRLSYHHRDRDFAGMFLARLLSETDSMMREQALAGLAAQTAKLQARIAAEANPANRRALTVLMMDQQQRQAMLAVDGPYAARIAEPVSTSPRPVWPRKGLTMLAFLFVGLIGGTVWAGVGVMRRVPAV